MEYDSQSWKERCDRYFTSISENDSPGNQEKEASRNIDQSKDEYASLRDITVFRHRSRQEHRVFRYMRKLLSALDIHGARFASKTRNTVELIMWVIIMVAAVAVLICFAYLQIKEFQEATSFNLNSFQSNVVVESSLAVSVCNNNLIRRSKLLNTKFEHLISLASNLPILAPPSQTTSPVTDHIASSKVISNVKLVKFLADNGINATALFVELNSDVGVNEVLKDSLVPLDQRLSDLGHPEIIRRRLLMSQPLETLGHRREDMLLDCWVDRRYCTQSEVSVTSDERHGRCVTVMPNTHSDTVTLTLNVERSEYVYMASPTVGFTAFLHHPGTLITAGTSLSVEPGQLTHVNIEGVKTVERNDGQCSPVAGMHEKCLSTCFHDLVNSICQCSSKIDGAKRQCDPDVAEDYICIETLRILNRNRKLPCMCTQNCRHQTYLTFVQQSIWPTPESVSFAQRYLTSKGYTFTAAEFSSNVAKMVVSTRPKNVEVYRQSGNTSLLELLARLGGLSALIAGMSLVTVGEICWTLIRMILDVVAFYKKRSNREAMPRRLSDSDITSVTWAMYRQRRREEESKDQQNNLRRTGQQHVIGGNVHARLSKRNGALPTVSEEQRDTGNIGGDDKNKSNTYTRYDPSHYESKQHSAVTRNGYRRNMDRRDGFRDGDNAGHFASVDEYLNPGNGVLVPRYQTPNPAPDLRSSRWPVANGIQVHNNDRHYPRPVSDQTYPPKTGNPAQPVQLYGNTSAYFHSHVSEPMYL